MGLTADDFALTDEQIDKINRHFSERSAAMAEAGEDAPWSATVEFEWVPGFGRSVMAYFDGAVGPFVIESCFDVDDDQSAD